jgi:hypothetical protein
MHRPLAVQDVFDVLLFGLPQGVLLGVVWTAYSAWTIFNRRRLMKLSADKAT